MQKLRQLNDDTKQLLSQQQQQSFLLKLTLLDVDQDSLIGSSRADILCNLLLSDKLIHTFVFSAKKNPKQSQLNYPQARHTSDEDHHRQQQQQECFTSCFPFCMSPGENISLIMEIAGQCYNQTLSQSFFAGLTPSKSYKWIEMPSSENQLMFHSSSEKESKDNGCYKLLFLIERTELVTQSPERKQQQSLLQKENNSKSKDLSDLDRQHEFDDVLSQTQQLIESVSALRNIADKVQQESNEAQLLNLRVNELGAYLVALFQYLQGEERLQRRNEMQVEGESSKKQSEKYQNYSGSKLEQISTQPMIFKENNKNPKILEEVIQTQPQMSTPMSKNLKISVNFSTESETNPSGSSSSCKKDKIDKNSSCQCLAPTTPKKLESLSEFANMSLSDMRKILRRIQGDVTRFLGLLGQQSSAGVGDASEGNRTANERDQLHNHQSYSHQPQPFEQTNCAQLSAKNEILRELLLGYGSKQLQNERIQRDINNRFLIAKRNQETYLAQAAEHNEQIEEEWKKQQQLEKQIKRYKQQNAEYTQDLNDCLFQMKQMNSIAWKNSEKSNNNSPSQRRNTQPDIEMNTEQMQHVYEQLKYYQKQVNILKDQKNELQLSIAANSPDTYQVLKPVPVQYSKCHKNNKINTSLQEFFDVFRQQNGESVRHYEWKPSYLDSQEQQQQEEGQRPSLSPYVINPSLLDVPEPSDLLGSMSNAITDKDYTKLKKTMQEKKSAINELLMTIDQM